MNTSTDILNKTIKELEARKQSVEFELYNIDNTITGIKTILLDSSEGSGPSIKTSPKTPRAKIRRRKRSKQTSRAIITENSVRDAIIDLVKNPPPKFKGGKVHELDSGFFVCAHIANRLGMTPSPKINKIVNKFEEKGLLESRKYKNGKQYRYIAPAESGINNISSSAEIRAERNVSSPIPGTSNNNVHTRNKDIEKLLNTARSQGFIITRLGSDHIRVEKQNGGLGGEKRITLSATGNKPYEVTKIRSDLSKIGVNI